MTAEQLEELLEHIEDRKSHFGLDLMPISAATVASLARRVIAAEKLVEANSDVDEAIRSFLAELRPNCPLVPTEIHEAIQASRAAITTYREASK